MPSVSLRTVLERMGRVGSDVVSLSSLSVWLTCFRRVPGWFPVLSSVSVLWLFSVVSPGGHGWTMLTSYVDTFLELQCLTVTSVVHMDAQHADTQFCSFRESFRFSFCMVFRTPRNMKPVKLKPQFFQFCLLKHSVFGCHV